MAERSPVPTAVGVGRKAMEGKGKKLEVKSASSSKIPIQNNSSLNTQNSERSTPFLSQEALLVHPTQQSGVKIPASVGIKTQNSAQRQ